MKIKTIAVTSETHDLLTSIGKKNETYDIIIHKLVRFYKRHNYFSKKGGENYNNIH